MTRKGRLTSGWPWRADGAWRAQVDEEGTPDETMRKWPLDATGEADEGEMPDETTRAHTGYVRAEDGADGMVCADVPDLDRVVPPR